MARRCLLLAACLFLAGLSKVALSDVPDRDLAPVVDSQALSRADRIKAAYLFHFTRFIRWPALPAEDGLPISLCLDTGSEFADFIKAMAAKAQRQSRRPVEVNLGADLQQLQRCHIVYARRAGQPLTAHPNALWVGDIDGPYHEQATILFFPQQQRLRFEIHMDRLRASGVFISSELLRLARIVGDS